MKTIKDAYKELNGDLTNTDCTHKIRHLHLWFNIEQGSYITLKNPPLLMPEIYQYICTVEEFNNYKPEKTVRDAVIEFKGDWPVIWDCMCTATEANYVYPTGLIRQSSDPTVNDMHRHLCTKSDFNLYVDLLASNMGRATQSYAEYKALYNSVMGGGQAGGRGGNGIPRPIQSPVYTQEMADAGVLPSVGMECQTSTGIVTVKYIGKKVVVSEDADGDEYTTSKKSALHSYKPLTPPITLIDGKAYQFDYKNNTGLIGICHTTLRHKTKHVMLCMPSLNSEYNSEFCTNIKPLTVEGE